MVLLNGKVQGGFENGFCLGPAREFQEEFPEEYVRHHPVGFFRDTKLEMRNGLGTAVVCDQRLREAEAEHLVSRMALDQRRKLLDAGGHASDFVDENDDGRRVIRAAAADGQ